MSPTPQAPTAAPEPARERPTRPLVEVALAYCHSWLAVLALVVLVAVVLVAILAPWISPQNPYDLTVIDIMEGRLPPGSEAYGGGV